MFGKGFDVRGRGRVSEVRQSCIVVCFVVVVVVAVGHGCEPRRMFFAVDWLAVGGDGRWYGDGRELWQRNFVN